MAAAAGIEFTEVMHGHLSTTTTRAHRREEYVIAETRGKAAGASIRLALRIRAEDVDAFLSDPAHRATLHGTVVAPAIAEGPMMVVDGTFDCLSEDTRQPDTKNLWYRMTLRADDGNEYLFEGYKVIRAGMVVKLWPHTTTLYTTVRKGGRPTDPVLAQGIMHVHAKDFLKQMATLRGVNAQGRSEARRAKTDFVTFFARNMLETYGGPIAPARAVNGTVRGRARRSLQAPASAVHQVRAADGTLIRITRFRGGDKGPVMLSHGLGVSSLIFSIDTIETNLVEFLVAHGYDVWLLDYRASIELASATTRFTADEVARLDYPAAVAAIRSLTGKPTIQVVAHCFGSTTFFMAMLAGLQGVRAAVCSQVGSHVLPPTVTRLKAAAHLDHVLAALRVTTMTAHASRNGAGRGRLLDGVLRLAPARPGEACRSEVCRRITFLYGLLYRHSNLNASTHDALGDLFGIANVAALQHLATMVRATHVVDAAGNNVYLPRVHRLGIPISILHGADNRCFRPDSTERTLEWMGAANGPDLYDRRVIPGYGHIDCIFGRDASRDVFPYIVERLELTAR